MVGGSLANKGKATVSGRAQIQRALSAAALAELWVSDATSW